MLTAERLRELLDYNPETGALTRLTRPAQRSRIGDVVGWTGAYGYTIVAVDGRDYLAHRLAWLHVHGRWPTADIDHINGDRADNRLENLREVTRGQNLQNQRRARRDNRTGILGVSYRADRGSWRAHIGAGGRQHHLGTFATPQEAHDAYVTAKRRLHEFGTL